MKKRIQNDALQYEDKYINLYIKNGIVDVSSNEDYG